MPAIPPAQWQRRPTMSRCHPPRRSMPASQSARPMLITRKWCWPSGRPHSGSCRPTRSTMSASRQAPTHGGATHRRHGHHAERGLTREQALLQSYRTAHEIYHDRWWYRQRQAELEAAYRDFDQAAHEVFGERERTRTKSLDTPRSRPAATTTKWARPWAPPATRVAHGRSQACVS